MTLSAAQRGLWALDQLAPRSAFYNVAVAYRLEGRLDVARLGAALATVVERHEVLRTSIEAEDGLPSARPRAAEDFGLQVDDLSALAPGRRDFEALRIAAAEAAAPFDLAAGIPFRARVCRLSEDDHLLSLTAHHVAADETALRIVLAEVSEAYAGAPLPPVRLQYADVARREAAALRGEDLDVLLAFWRKNLRDAPALLHLPADHAPPGAPTFKGATIEGSVDGGTVAALEELARRREASLEDVVLAAWAVLLHRYSSDEDLVMGWPVDSRDDDTRGVVGTFVNVLPLRVQVHADDPFPDVLARVSQAAAAARNHRDLPFETMIEELRPRRGAGHSPLFQVAVSFGEDAAVELRLPAIAAERIALEPATTQFDLFLDARRGAGGLRGCFDLATDVFDPATVHGLARHWANLLREIARAPELRVAAFALLDDAERAEVVRRSAGPPAPAADVLVHDAVLERARRAPDAVAVVAPDGDVTYAELDRGSAAVAAALAERGVARGSVVAVLMGRTSSMVPALLGILRAGCAYLPLDPSYPPERLRFMLGDSGAAAVVGDAAPPGLQDAVLVDPAGAEGNAPPVDTGPRDLAYVIYTSGSTGRPKGVMVEHRSLARFASTICDELALTESDRVLQFASLSFDTAVEEIWPALVRGATLVLRDPHPWDPDELRRKVDEHGITVLDLPTAYWHEVAAACGEGIDVRDAPSLRLVVVGGEAMSADRTRTWHASAPRPVALLNTYGPTETTVTATSFDAAGWGPVDAGVPIGGPLSGVRAYVLDEEREPVPDGVVGELHVGGSGVARGYLGRPGTTAERFVPDPWPENPGERMYATGDLVRRRRDGVLEFIGRRDHQVKIRGFRIEPGEVEAVLAAHPGVADAAVVTVTGERPRLAAYFVPARDDPADAAAVTSWLRDRLPEHMVPPVVTDLDVLPKTPGGKVDRVALAALEPDAGERAVAGPRTPAEEVLASMWQKLLGVADVGVDESFFDLGGHSLVATQLVSRIRHAFGVSLPLRTVFEWPTIAGLAAVIERSAAGPDEFDELPLEPVARDAPLPLSFAQQRLWFIDQFKPASADYVIAARAELHGPLDIAALRDALTALARRHEALRTTFPARGGEARQDVASEPVVELETFDLSAERPEDRPERAAELVQAEASRPFDLSTGPLWRTALIRLEEQRHVFVTCMHHIVSDGWSLGIFSSELSELYNARLEGREPDLPELEVAYADFAVWQRRWFAGAELERQLSYWKERLHGAPAVLELPTDRPRPPIQSFEGATAGATFPRRLSDAIGEVARAHEVTTFMVTLAAFELLLHRYTGAADVVVGSPIAGRNRSEIEGLIGFFVNTLVLRTDLSGDPTFAELLERVREVALGAYAHQDLPFEKLVEELGIDRDLAHSPAVQVMFVFQNTPPGDLALAGVEPARLDAPTNEVAVDVTLDLTETDAGLAAQVVYNADLFERATIEALLRHFGNVLTAVVDDPDTPLSRVELLDPEERGAILSEFNPPPTPYPDDVRVHELFERVARERADAPAVAHGSTSLTYGELNARANRLARHLVANGVGRGDLVAVVLDRGPDLVVSLLAILKAGAAYLPIDPENPTRRTTFMLQDAEARVLITAGAVPDDAAGAVVLLDRDAEAIASHPGEDLAVPGDAGDLAYAIYTSGSTGTPKGICIPHRAIARLVLDTDYVKLGPHSVVAQIANASFDAATFEIWGPLLNGGVAAVIDKEVVLDARRLRAALEGHGADSAFVTTALFNQLVAEDPSLFSSMETVLVGGETLDPSMVRRCLEADPPARLLNVYGPTESTTFATWHHIQSVAEGATSIPIGRPIANTKVHVLDPAMNPVPVGVPGEIHVGGPGLAVGYLDRPELTKERFVPDPFSSDPEARLYKTGDLGRYLPSGDVEFLARIDSQVKIRGFRVELGEIEAVLAEHPAVTEAAASVVEASPGDKRLVAYVAGGGDAVPVAELRRFVSERVPFYMVPSDYVELDSLPLNANGKVDRRALPVPDPSRQRAAEEHVAPRNPTEEKLLTIWEELLGRRGVGVHDGFFELGGHSLLATQMVSRIRDAVGVELELRAVFEAPTIARLAPRVESAPPAETSSVPQLKALPRR